jgi:uncharacterized protein (TIGR02118 family)
MASVLVMYHHPENPAAFDEYYRSTHTPLAQKIPGLRAFRLSQGPVNAASGPSPYHLIVELMFDSMADIQTGMASPEGQAAVADLQNFAGAGVTVLLYDTHDA